MKYRVETASMIGDLKRMVNEALADGWRPTGGIVAVKEVAGTWLFLQALVLEEKS